MPRYELIKWNLETFHYVKERKDRLRAIFNLIFYGSFLSAYLFGYVDDVWARKQDFDRASVSKPLYYVFFERFKYGSYVNLVRIDDF